MGDEANDPRMVQFEPFPRLPKEIRLKIWEHAIQEPCIVEIWQQPDYEPRAPQNGRETSEDEFGNEETTEETNEEVEEEPRSTNPINPDPPAPPPIIQAATDNGSKKSSDSDSDDEEDERYVEPINPNPFFTPTPIPPILHATQESRCIALKHYTPPFPVSPSEPPIFYNAANDILYFPPWCFQHNISQFERWISCSAKAKIRKIAIENLVWYAYIEDGSINNQIQISEFRGLEEFYLVSRKPDFSGCGCCHDFEGPDRGVLGFEVDPREPVGEEGEGEGEEARRRDNRRTFRDNVRDGVEEQFGKIREKDPEWRTPELKFVKVMRDGVEV
jgi:hypothetical protein